MSDLSGLVKGLSEGLNSYLQASQQQQRQQQNFAFQQQQVQQTHAAEGATDIEQAGKVTPEMAESLIPGSSKWVNSFQQNKGRLPTIDETKNGLYDVVEKLSASKEKEGKSNIKHYLGNDPEGNAIFADNSGKMTSPDGSLYTGKVFPKSSNMPTSTTRGSAEFATTLLPHITEMRQLIQEADQKGYIGPASGRMYNQFLAGKIGSTGDEEADRILGKLRAMDSLMKSGAMRVHFGARGGQQMYDHFSEMLNSGKQSAANLNGSLDTLESFMQGYAQAGSLTGKITSQSQQPSNDIEAKRAALRAKLGL